MKRTTLLLIILILLLGSVFPVLAQGDGNALTGSVIFGTAILREGPGPGFAELAQIAQGEVLVLNGRLPDSTWYQTTLDDGTTAWVADYLVNVNGDPALLPVMAFEPPQSDTLYVPPGCDYFNIGPFRGRVGQSVVLTQGWEATSQELLNDYLDNVLQVVAFDGRLISTYSASRSEPFYDEARGTWRVFWSFNLGPVAAGEHVTEWTQMFSQEITDGLDANGDGQPDRYGPQNLTYRCTVVIE